MILVDTNVLLDLLGADTMWGAWSEARLNEGRLAGGLGIDPVVYAELSARMPSEAELDRFLADLEVTLCGTPKRALYLAGKVYLAYRRQGGTRTGVLPDFFIGAHAAVAGLPLLTRDVRRYRAWFPTVRLIAPAP